MLRARIRGWKSGRFTELWDSTNRTERQSKSKRQNPAQRSSGLSPKDAKRIAQLVDMGRHSQAASQLCSPGIAVGTHARVDKLFHMAPSPIPATFACPDAPDVELDVKTLRKALLDTPKGLAPGPSGLRIERLRTMLEGNRLSVEDGLLEALTSLANSAVAGRLPLSLQPYVGIRPIVVGEVLRSLIAKAALTKYGTGLENLQPLQVGIGVKGLWSQAAVMTYTVGWTRCSMAVLVRVDISNAFNSINRSSCLQGVQNCAPGFSAWASWCLAQPSHNFWDGPWFPALLMFSRAILVLPSSLPPDFMTSWRDFQTNSLTLNMSGI